MCEELVHFVLSDLTFAIFGVFHDLSPSFSYYKCYTNNNKNNTASCSHSLSNTYRTSMQHPSEKDTVIWSMDHIHPHKATELSITAAGTANVHWFNINSAFAHYHHTHKEPLP